MKRFILFLGLALLTGCAASVNTTSKVQHQSDGFASAFLAADTVAVLPITGGTPVSRRAIATAVDSVLQARRSDAVVLPADHVSTTMQSKGLVGPYQKAVTAYAQTGIMDQRVITELAGALQADFLLQASAGAFQSQAEAGQSGLTGDVRSYENEETRVFGRVWTAASGELSWEGYAEASAFESDVTYIKAEPEEYYLKATAELINKLMGLEESDN